MCAMNEGEIYRKRILDAILEGMKDALMARAKEVKENMDSLLVGVPSKTGKKTLCNLSSCGV